MGRKKQSGNRYISIKTRHEYDPQMLMDPGADLDPIYWFNLLRRKSRRIVYIIRDISKDEQTAESVDIDDYVEINGDIQPLKPTVIVTPSGPRQNDHLQYELAGLYEYITRYFIKNTLSENPIKGKAEIMSTIAGLARIVHLAIEESRNWENPGIGESAFEYCFLLHRRNGRFEEIGQPANFDRLLESNQKHDRLLSASLKSWHEFWLAHQPYIEELRNTFQCNSTFKLKSGISYQNQAFTRWLEQGVDEFLEPMNQKITSMETQIKYLKYVILTHQYPKRKK